MWMYYFAIALTIAANIFYHIFQKSTPSNANPILSLMITYMVASMVCLVVLPFTLGKENISEAFKKISVVSVFLGVAIVGLELGFLLAYRAGWNIKLAGMVSNVIVSILLIPVGLIYFHEKLSIPNIAGIILCLGGILLINF